MEGRSKGVEEGRSGGVKKELRIMITPLFSQQG